MIAQTCVACGEPKQHSLCFTVNGCEIWRCRSCGLGSTKVADFNPRSYYTADYFSGGHRDGYADYRGAEIVLRREFSHTVEFIRRYRAGGRLLDLGCAYGFFLREAQAYFDVAGLELAEDAAAACRAAGLQVLSGMADEASMARLGEADVITLLDVIEHLPQPQETLALCSRYLRPGGILVITTGDFGSLAARLMGRRWRLMTPPQHLWFFTRASLQRMAAANGLSMVAFDHPGKIVPLSLILFQLRRMMGLRGAGAGAASGIGVPVNVFDAMRVVLRKDGSPSGTSHGP